jgi:hypothetical protein
LKGIKIISDSDVVDSIIMHFPFDIWAMADRNEVILPFIEATVDAKRCVKKPVMVVLHHCVTPDAKNLAAIAEERFVKAGIAVYPSMKRAARAINKYILYDELCKKKAS